MTRTQLLSAPALGAASQPVDKPRQHNREWFRKYRATRTAPTPHGTQNGYANWACRCDKCRQAHRIHVAEWRTSRMNAHELPPQCVHHADPDTCHDCWPLTEHLGAAIRRARAARRGPVQEALEPADTGRAICGRDG